MSRSTVSLLLVGAIFVSTSSAARKQPSCEEFSQGSTFSSDQALGTWYLLPLKKPHNSRDANCVNFSAVSDKERKDLQAELGKHVADLKWENLALKMQVSCMEEVVSGKTKGYFLEKLETDGFYKTLELPPTSAKLESADFHRHPMRLKLVEQKYLAMMDCKEHFMFLLDKEDHGKEMDPALKKSLEVYMPEEY